MGYFDYTREPRSDIAFIDMKSFYASVECVERGLHPLKTSLCVMSRADNSAGLILASSPIFKSVFGKSNVGRAYDLPFDVQTRKFSYYNAKKQGLRTDPEYVRFIEDWAKVTFIVPPRMDEYIAVNMEIQGIFQNYVSPNDIYPYSIDEGFIDLSSSLNYFVPDKQLSRKQKLALDNEAKKTPTMRANWSYEDVEQKVWSIPNMTDFWGIGKRMEKRFNTLGIYSIKDLANANPDILKKELGVAGIRLWFHANGIDESNVHKPYKPKSKGLGNSQVLPRDYFRQRDIEIILREMAEQVAIRLRKIGKKATVVSIHLGYSKHENKRSINTQMKIEPTNNTDLLTNYVLKLFHNKYTSGAIRSVAVNYSGFVDESFGLISLFDDVEQIEKEERLQTAIDSIRDQFGFTSLLKANALDSASRSIARSSLIGGHSAGGLDGLK